MSHQKIQESYLLLEMTWESRNACASVSGTQYIGLGRQPTLEDTRVVELGSRNLIQACPKIQHLMWDSLFRISKPIYPQDHILLLTGNESQVKEFSTPSPTFSPAFLDTPTTLPFLSITSIPLSNSGLLTIATVNALVKPAGLKGILL